MFFVVLLVFAAVHACPVTPSFRDPDGVITALEQNLKFITTGARRDERAELLAGWLEGAGRDVDVLLLSEARLTDHLTSRLPGFCFYTPDGEGLDSPYVWAPLDRHRAPGGLVFGLRVRPDGRERVVSTAAGRRFRAAPTSVAEGLLGRVARYRKGWAEVSIDGSRIVWSHTQASYRARPELGAGGPGRGRAGQFDDLAADLGRPETPVLLTGDLNLLDHLPSLREASRRGRRVERAGRVDQETIARFEAHTGIEFHWSRPGLRTDARGSFFGRLFQHDDDAPWDDGAHYDRVGVNPSFLRRHPGVRVRPISIGLGGLRLSDHDGLEIVIPFGEGI